MRERKSFFRSAFSSLPTHLSAEWFVKPLAEDSTHVVEEQELTTQSRTGFSIFFRGGRHQSPHSFPQIAQRRLKVEDHRFQPCALAPRVQQRRKAIFTPFDQALGHPFEHAGAGGGLWEVWHVGRVRLSVGRVGRRLAAAAERGKPICRNRL